MYASKIGIMLMKQKQVKLIIQWVIIMMAVGGSVTKAENIKAEDQQNPSIEKAVKDNNGFALKMYQQLSKKEGNVFFSPYSISVAMDMAYSGARGNTAEEMKAVLSPGLEQSELPTVLKQLNVGLAASAREGGQKLNIANGLCLTGGDVSPEYKNLLKQSYDAEIFRGDVDAINNWVNKQTEGKIEKILKQLDPNSVCVILNAIYFKGQWANQFKKEHTRKSPFKVSATKQVDVPLMYQKGKFQLTRQKDFQIISLPYAGGQFSMFVLLPHQIDGLATIKKQLTSENINQWVSALDRVRKQTVMLSLPQFKCETEYDLGSSLKNLGIKDAFLDSKADFQGMGWPKGKLWISQVKHKAFIDVNEEGTEAAAATAVEMATRGMPRYPVFRADHPFLFFIRDHQSGSILFMGRMNDPSNQ